MFTELTFLLFYKNLSMNLVHMYKVNFLMKKNTKAHMHTKYRVYKSTQVYNTLNKYMHNLNK